MCYTNFENHDRSQTQSAILIVNRSYCRLTQIKVKFHIFYYRSSLLQIPIFAYIHWGVLQIKQGQLSRHKLFCNWQKEVGNMQQRLIIHLVGCGLLGYSSVHSGRCLPIFQRCFLHYSPNGWKPPTRLCIAVTHKITVWTVITMNTYHEKYFPANCIYHL